MNNDEKRMYDFNLDTLLIGDFVEIIMLDTNVPIKLARLLEIIQRHTNTDIMQLPSWEISNLVKQFTEAIMTHHKQYW